MKKIGIVITDPEDWTARALIKAAKEKRFSPFVLDLRTAEVSVSSAGAPESAAFFKAGKTLLSDLDALIVRDAGAGAFEGVSFRFDMLRELEAQGVPVINSPEAIQNAANKYHASYLLAKAGLPVPETRAVQSVEAALKVISRFGDAVIKPVFGYKGKDIARVKEGEIRFSDKKTGPVPVEETVESLLEERGMLYIQEFIENPGRDIRAFVVGDTVIGAIYRKAAAGSWVNNLSQGGSSDKCVLTAEQRKIAEKASFTIGTTFAGIDIIEGTESVEGSESVEGPESVEKPEGFIENKNKKGKGQSNGGKQSSRILEVNGTPSGKGIFDAWGINPAEHILEYLENIL